LELSKIYRPTTFRLMVPDETDCPDLLQIIAEIARVGGVADSGYRPGTVLSLEELKKKIKERGYEIRRSSLYYR